MKNVLGLFIATIIGMTSCEEKSQDELIFNDNFNSDLSKWTVEQVSGGTSQITEGQLEIDDVDGCTIWFNEKMSGDIRIEYDIVMIDEGGPNDRVSDLNCFWKAIDPSSPDDILANSNSRTGKFNNYHGFRLYYVGFGANNNTSTRFRRYPGDGTRPLLPEHDLTDSTLMNKANVQRHVRIICQGNQTIYKIDDITVFDFTDEEPFTDGWFGLRTVANHMTVDNFKVYSLE